MHKTLIKMANDEQLREFVTDSMSMIKETHKDLYDDLEMHLYKELYGCHFSDWMLDKALNKMKNSDGSMGGHWNVEQTTSVAKQNGINFETFNEYDLCYVMNMMYSDYYKYFGNDLNVYVKLTKGFLEDIDAPKGKALKYYLAMKD